MGNTKILLILRLRSDQVVSMDDSPMGEITLDFGLWYGRHSNQSPKLMTFGMAANQTKAQTRSGGTQTRPPQISVV
jgi:hypothetical protein